MPAYTGRQGKIKLAAASATTAGGEAFTAVATTTDVTVYRITDTAKRHWDKTVAPAVSRNSTAVGSTEYAVNYVTGEITFAVAQTTADTITADLSYLATSYLADTKGWELDIETDQLDVTTLSTTTGDTQWRSFANGLSGAGITLDRLYRSGSTALPFFDRNIADQQVLVELIVTDDDKFECFANVSGDEFESVVDALSMETVTLQVDGQVAFSTY